MIHHKSFSSKKIGNSVSAGICLLFGCMLFSGCTKNSPIDFLETNTENPEEIAAFDSFLNDFFCAEVSSNTINLHYTLANPENYGITDAAITLGDLSEQAFSDSNARFENYLAALDDFDYNTLSTDQQLTYDVLEDYLNLQLDTADYYLYDEPLRPSTGVQAELPILFQEYDFYDREDIDTYLELISLTDEYFEQVIAFEEEKAGAGLFMSDDSCDTVITQCEDFLADAENHYLIETFNMKIDSFEGLTDAEKDAYKTQNQKLIQENIIPAYENLMTALTGLLGSGTNDKGLCYLPEGKEYYEKLVYFNTGCSDSIKEIQEMISKERALDFQESADLTAENPSLWDICNEATLAAVDPTTTLNSLKEIMQKDFPSPPDASFTIFYIDECVADYLAPAFYVTSAIDDYQNNSIYINESMNATDISYFTTLAHEGYPGHLYQTIMSYNAGLSPARCILNYPGYVEGWATYVEMLSYTYAGLDEDVASLMEKNQTAILSLYASTDLGIHYDGWSFEDTLQFWQNYGITDEAAIKELYELIVQEPAHYLKYYVGYLQFEELKEYAKTHYLYKYSDTNFHAAVLKIGPAPFAIIEKYLDEYYMTDET